MNKGTVKWFNNEKGYGFIIGEDGKDVFVHYTSISGKDKRNLFDDDIVEFEIGMGNNNRKQAVNVIPILTLSMVIDELKKEKFHLSRLVDDKGKHGWQIVDKKENVIVDKEMNLIELAAYVGIDVEGM